MLAGLPLIDQRAALALREIKRRLENNLPGLIDAVNTAQGRTGTAVLLKPARYAIAPMVNLPDYLNSVVVSLSVQTETLAARRFRNELKVVVFSVEARPDTEELATDMYDRAGLIRGVLNYFVTGCKDANGRWAWRQLLPTGIGALPDGLEEYGGTASYFNVTQLPPDNNWATA
jgi:hypothetical protein